MKLPRFILTAALYAAFLSGCAGSGSNSTNHQAIVTHELKGKELLAPDGIEESASVTQVEQGANEFAFQLTTELLKEREKENFICSPYSVWLPLAALTNGVEDEHQESLMTVLGGKNLTVDDINQTSSRMMYDFTRNEGKDGDTPLKIANAVFVAQDKTLNKNFAQVYADYYRGQAFGVDFSSKKAVDAVNKWASEHTEGLIENLIEKFDPQTVAAIANAIYFSDQWSWEFDEDDTQQDTFYGVDDKETQADFMLREGMNQIYYEDDQLQAMPLKFTSGGALYILLPKEEDAVRLLSSMDETYFQKIQDDAVPAEGKLLLPKFTIDSGVMELKEGLDKLGVPLFDENSAALTDLIEDDYPVYLSSALQKAVIEVDENGTTAAAVTVMAGETAGALPEYINEKFEMICNKPFAFILCGKTYAGRNQVLFTGVVNQPE